MSITTTSPADTQLRQSFPLVSRYFTAAYGLEQSPPGDVLETALEIFHERGDATTGGALVAMVRALEAWRENGCGDAIARAACSSRRSLTSGRPFILSCGQGDILPLELLAEGGQIGR